MSIDAVAYLFCFLVVYLFPWFLSKGRQHKNSLPIFWTNFLLGWTIIGWFYCLIWSMTSHTRNSPA